MNGPNPKCRARTDPKAAEDGIPPKLIQPPQNLDRIDRKTPWYETEEIYFRIIHTYDVLQAIRLSSNVDKLDIAKSAGEPLVSLLNWFF